MATVDKNAKALLETARIKGLQQLCIKRRENELKMHPKTKISYKSLKAVIDNMQKAKRKVKKPLDIKLFCTNNSKEQFQYGTINAVYVGIRQSILKRNWKALAYLLKVGLHSKNPKHRQHLLKMCEMVFKVHPNSADLHGEYLRLTEEMKEQEVE